MPSRISKLTSSLKHLGEIEVTELDFMDLLNTDIRELEIGRSLRKLGNIRVTEWDFRTVLPAVNKLAHKEVDLVDIVKRTARYKVMDWDFRSALHPATGEAPSAKPTLNPDEMQALIVRLKEFLHFVTMNLIDEPNHAQIKVQEIAPKVIRFRLVLVKRDVAMLIGKEGHTASAIRGLLKAAAAHHGVAALLQIHSHEEEMAMNHDPKRRA